VEVVPVVEEKGFDNLEEDWEGESWTEDSIFVDLGKILLGIFETIPPSAAHVLEVAEPQPEKREVD
jgi:hypothetical protein